jgi:hypothetical protein
VRSSRPSMVSPRQTSSNGILPWGLGAKACGRTHMLALRCCDGDKGCCIVKVDEKKWLQFSGLIEVMDAVLILEIML